MSPHRCPDCGATAGANDEMCGECGAELFETYDPAEESDSTGGLIPYKNGMALTAYYLGVFSIIPCFPIGLAAFICGIYGLKRYKAKPAVRGVVHAWIGIVLGAVFGFGWLALMLIFWAFQDS